MRWCETHQLRITEVPDVDNVVVDEADTFLQRLVPKAEPGR